MPLERQETDYRGFTSGSLNKNMSGSFKYVGLHAHAVGQLKERLQRTHCSYAKLQGRRLKEL